ncbi:MAG: ribonuclease Z [Candidatus Tectomicrobia bacterium]|uniref:Ribonuclease Z n=1 Tax=Tectimicrobiota bacterium TaxID=2528274 RepID=A0A932CN59_UNCTE|nr:ribonuclease Z [Candidatus Tectomicrobia bacterium]
MSATFHARLIHEPFGDPGLFVRLQWEGRALLFDIGDLSPLPAGELLRVTDVFVSHTHMDHFVGFDQLLRLILGREKALRLFGPPGILANVEGKVQGYTWNLVDSYPLILEVREVHPTEVRGALFRCRERFKRYDLEIVPFDGTLLDEPLFSVQAVHLDHGIPCLGFALEEKAHLNIDKGRLDLLGWPVGPWLGELKQRIRDGAPDEAPFVARWKRNGEVEERTFALGALKAELVRITPGQKLAYVTDIRYSPENHRKVVALARNADLFFCETMYAGQDHEMAQERNHLTAGQAGALAREANAKRLLPFHFSPRYRDQLELLLREAQEAFGELITESS